MPFYRKTVNVIWCSMWFGILYTAILGCVSVFAKDQSVGDRQNWTMVGAAAVLTLLRAFCIVPAIRCTNRARFSAPRHPFLLSQPAIH